MSGRRKMPQVTWVDLGAVLKAFEDSTEITLVGFNRVLTGARPTATVSVLKRRIEQRIGLREAFDKTAEELSGSVHFKFFYDREKKLAKIHLINGEAKGSACNVTLDSENNVRSLEYEELLPDTHAVQLKGSRSDVAITRKRLKMEFRARPGYPPETIQHIISKQRQRLVSALPKSYECITIFEKMCAHSDQPRL